MIKYIYSVQDLKAKVFGNLFCDVADGSAIRNFEDAIRSKQGYSPLSAHPEDFILYKLGSFDDSIGDIKADFENDFEPIAYGSDFAHNSSIETDSQTVTLS